MDQIMDEVNDLKELWETDLEVSFTLLLAFEKKDLKAKLHKGCKKLHEDSIW